MSHQRENINNKTEIMKEKQMKILELESAVAEMKYSLEGIKSRFELEKGRISELGDKSMETMQFEELRGKEEVGRASENYVTPLNTQDMHN